MTRRVEITVSEETWQRLEDLRGHEPRASFVKRALENALADEPTSLPSKALREAFESPALETQFYEAPAQRLGKGFVPPRPKGA